MTLPELSALAAKATPAGGGDISALLDACSPEVIAALCRVAGAAKAFADRRCQPIRSMMEPDEIALVDALSALESVGR